MAGPSSPLITPSSPTLSIRTTAGRQVGHHRRQSSSILASILQTATAVFTSPTSPSTGVFYDEEAKLGESSSGGMLDKDIKRVELKIGGMTVGPMRPSLGAVLIIVRRMCSSHRIPAHAARYSLGPDITAR